MAVIVFHNGERLNAEQNGSCYIAETRPDFPSDMSIVTVQAEDGTREYHNAQVLECASVDGRYWFAFAEESEEKRREDALQARINFLEECLMEMSEEVYK